MRQINFFLMSLFGVAKQAIVLLAMLAVIPASYAIRDASIASYVSAPHSGSSIILRGGLFAFSGGVIARGDMSFFAEDGRKLAPRDVALVADPATGRTAVRWEGRSYDVAIQRNLACPLAKFVKNDGLIAFTIAVVAHNRAFMEKLGLVPLGEKIYVARDLMDHKDLLTKIDLSDGVKDINDRGIERFILDSMNEMVKQSANSLSSIGALGDEGDGTYVNADFNVMYQAYLVKQANRLFVDVAGLPLRYFWTLSADRKTPVFGKVSTFTFPTKGDREQLLAVTFFQNAALFRRFKLQNDGAFARYVETICSAK